MKRIASLALILILAVGISPVDASLIPPVMANLPNVYSPNLNITLNTGRTAVHAFGNLDIQGDTILLLDISSSMKDQKRRPRPAPFTSMKQAAILLCRTILEDSDNRVAIVTFTTTPQLASGFVDADGLNSLISVINGLKVRSRTKKDTNIDRAITAVDEFFDASSSAEERNIFVLTDGLPNVISPKRVRNSPGTPFAGSDHKHHREANTTVATFVSLHNKYNIYPIGFVHKTNAIVSSQLKNRDLAFIQKFLTEIATDEHP